jgi:uncharacterized Rossmann fold enzyme
MKYKNWDSIYKRILKDFGFSYKQDANAADILDNLIQVKKNRISIKKLAALIRQRDIIIFGAGPSLISTINKYRNLFRGKITISVDGATSALIENDIFPDIIVTDLDGKISDQIKANLHGSIVIIHAHGDNIDKIKRYVPKFKGKIIGTTQIDTEIYNNIYNFGGFTDGDRAVYITYEFKPKKITLVGFDFDNIIGEYSFTKNKKQKLKKLKWCKYLIEIIDKKNIISYL